MRIGTIGGRGASAGAIAGLTEPALAVRVKVCKMEGAGTLRAVDVAPSTAAATS